MKSSPRDFYGNQLVSLGEFDANKRTYRSSAEELYDAVDFCYELRALSFELANREDRTYYEWDPLRDDSDDELTLDNNKLIDFYYAQNFGTVLDDSPESQATRSSFLDKARDKIGVTKEITGILCHLLNSKPKDTESHSQMRLRKIIEDFRQENTEDAMFGQKGAGVAEIYMHEISEFMDYYKSTTLSRYVYQDNQAGYEVVPVDIETYEQIDKARETFIAGLPSLRERGLIDEDQLKRAIEICENIDILITDPLSEVFYKRPDTEEFGIGYFILNDRAIFINSDLIRAGERKRSQGKAPEAQQELYYRAVIRTLYHELIHSISNNWYSSRNYEVETLDLIERDYRKDENGDEIIKTQLETEYVPHSLYPRFLNEALTEMLTKELFQQSYGKNDDDRFSYPIEREIVTVLFEKIDWDKAGIDEVEAKQLLLKAFFDSGSEAQSTKRPVESYIEFFRALHVAADPGILKRMGKIDSLFGASFLSAIVGSNSFDPSESLSIVNNPSSRLMSNVNYYAGVNQIIPDIYENSLFANLKIYRHEKSQLARKVERAHKTFLRAHKSELIVKYGLSMARYLPPKPEDVLLRAIFGDEPTPPPSINRATKELQASVEEFESLKQP